MSDRDHPRPGRPRDYPRQRSAPLHVPITVEDEGSIPVYIPPGVPVPPRDPNSRVRHYTTPEHYAEADQRRLERLVAPIQAQVTSVDNRVAQVEVGLNEFISWSRDHELEKTEERVKLRLAVESIQATALAKREERTHRGRVLFGAIVGAVVTLALKYLGLV